MSQHPICLWYCLFLRPVNYFKATRPARDQICTVEVQQGDAGCVSTTKADIVAFSFVSTILELRDNLAKNGVFILPVSSEFIICLLNVMFKLQWKAYRRGHTSYSLNLIRTEYSSMHPNSSVQWIICEQAWQKEEEEKSISAQNAYASKIMNNKNEHENILSKTLKN